jgi:hypothetical protein
MQRLHEISLSLATIHKVLARNDERFLKTKRHYRKQAHRYNCQLPGERVQMDLCKIANHLYQYTAIDDCTRYKVIALYGRRSAENTSWTKSWTGCPFRFSVSRPTGGRNSLPTKCRNG